MTKTEFQYIYIFIYKISKSNFQLFKTIQAMQVYQKDCGRINNIK